MPANGDCQRGNKLKFINEIPTGNTRMFRNCDIASCEIQTDMDIGTPPNRASLMSSSHKSPPVYNVAQWWRIQISKRKVAGLFDFVKEQSDFFSSIPKSPNGKKTSV